MNGTAVEARPGNEHRTSTSAERFRDGRRATTPATIFLVDDDPAVRKSLTRVLSCAGYAVEACASAGDFLTRQPFVRPCCAVLDVPMPGLTGLDVHEALARSEHPVPVVFITGHGDIPMSVRAMKQGAVDFLTKPLDIDGLLRAVERAVAQDAANLDEERLTADVRARVNRLTARETDVFALVVTGLLNKQIAGELGITERTVKAHRARVMEKMRAGSVAELVHLADRSGVMARTVRPSVAA